MSKLNCLDWIALILVIVGGINWGLIAIDPTWNLVPIIFRVGWLITTVYALVGLSGLYTIYILARGEKTETTI